MVGMERKDGEYEKANDREIRNGNGSSNAITKGGKMVTDGGPARVGVAVLADEADGGGSRATAEHQSHHQQVMETKEEKYVEIERGTSVAAWTS